jgi:hypothetical protein
MPLLVFSPTMKDVSAVISPALFVWMALLTPLLVFSPTTKNARIAIQPALFIRMAYFSCNINLNNDSL